jgi:hypothetical protein
MFNGWTITNILDVGPCELDTVDGPYSKTGYRKAARARRLRRMAVESLGLKKVRGAVTGTTYYE